MGWGDTANGAQGHRPVQALLLRMAHNDGKFSVMALTTLLLGTVSVSSGTTKLSVLGSLVRLVHMAQFESALCESSLGDRGTLRGCGSQSPWAGSPTPLKEVRGCRGPGVPSALAVPWKPPNTTPRARCLQDQDSLCLPSFLLLPAQPCLPSHGTQC